GGTRDPARRRAPPARGNRSEDARGGGPDGGQHEQRVDASQRRRRRPGPRQQGRAGDLAERAGGRGDRQQRDPGGVVGLDEHDRQRQRDQRGGGDPRQRPLDRVAGTRADEEGGHLVGADDGHQDDGGEDRLGPNEHDAAGGEGREQGEHEDAEGGHPPPGAGHAGAVRAAGDADGDDGAQGETAHQAGQAGQRGEHRQRRQPGGEVGLPLHRAPGPYDLPGGEADGDRQGERRGGRRGAHRGHEDHEPPDPQTDPGAVDVVDDGEAAAVDGAAAVLARRRAP